MREYKVKLRVKVKGFFGPQFEGVEVYEAETAADALDKCRQDFKDKLFPYEDEATIEILDVEAV